MNRSANFAAGVGVVMSWAAGTNAGLLQNPGLELGGDNNSADGWTLVEPDLNDTGAPVNSAEFAPFANHEAGGSRGLWFRSFEGGLSAGSPPTVSATLYQDVPGVPGENYMVSAWFRYEANYSGADPMSPTATDLFIEFLGAGDALIASTVLDVDAVQDNDNVWRQFSVNGVAPAGTMTVRVGASMFDGVSTQMNQSAFVDDFDLVPSPAGAAVLGLMGMFGAGRRRRS